MAPLLKKVATRNYRSLADISVELGPVSVLFGPNGAGKSTFLDVLWFVWDCATRGVDMACSARGQGAGLLWDGAAEGEGLAITLETTGVRYELSLGLTAGRIEPFAGERLHSLERDAVCIDRKVGSPRADFYSSRGEPASVNLRDPDKLSLGRYLDFEEGLREVNELDRLLRLMHLLHARSLSLYSLKKHGSEATHETRIGWNGQNLWSVLRNLHDRQRIDDRYETITRFMARSFPGFDGLVFEQTGLGSIYCSFLEKGRRRPVLASGVSDGHVQMLLLLTALFAEGRDQDSLLLLDEPEISLHPWALAVFAEAVKLAASHWNKQVVIATHSPVLLSQFEPTECLATERQEGRTRMRRVSEIEGVAQLTRAEW
jgi:predicted ATPase